MIYLIMIGVALVLLVLAMGKKQDDVTAFLAKQNKESDKEIDYKAINIKMLTDEPFMVRIRVGIDNLKNRVGEPLWLKGLLFASFVFSVSFMGMNYIDTPFYFIFPLVLITSSLMLVVALQAYDRKAFETSFPNALNLLNGAVSSGESLMHAIIYVGNSLDGPVGREFKLMGQRLRMGQPPEKVLSQSCRRFPYGPFYFFTITLRANINRGGQLKEIIKRLNRVMFNNQSVEKKKKAMTGEARMSAWIVFAIPFFIMGIMYIINPTNINYMLHDDEGVYILYYVLGSEFLGMMIIWLLMKRVQS